jgi:ABC-2 type transport system ATP-binding protein
MAETGDLTRRRIVTHPAIHEPVVEVRGLLKEFRQGFWRRRTAALQGVSFRVNQGEVFGFLGPNGAGKTTTMKILMGLLHASGGQARVLGAAAGDRAAKAKIGYLPENPYFYDHLSAQEFLNVVAVLHGLDTATTRRRCGELLERVGLSVAKKRPMRTYSKGMMQRVGLAQALVNDPELVILDEPMSGLDPVGRREVRDIIVDLRNKGKTVFFSTHILADAESLCDRVAIVVKGSVRHEGQLGELLNRQILRIDVRFEGEASLVEELKTNESVQSTSEGYLISTDTREKADRALATIVRLGGRVVALTPHRQTLEDVFLRDAGGHGEAVRS